MSIRNVKTSCGCTKAYATSTPVERDDKAQVLIGIAISKDGPFSVKLSFDTTHGTIAIRLKGHASPRVAINTLQATFSEEDNLFKVPVTINDDSVPIDSLKFFVGDSAIAFTKLEDRKLVLDIAPKASNQVIATNITPFIGTVALPPASIRLAIPGEVDLLTKQVLSREGKFDLVFRGDLDAIADKTPTLHQKMNEWEIESQSFRRGSTLYIRCKTPDGLVTSERFTIQIGDMVFERDMVTL